MISNNDRLLVLSIINYLQSIKGDTSNATFVEEAVRLLESSFSVDSFSSEARSTNGAGADLSKIFADYLQKNSIQMANDAKPVDPNNNPALKEFISNLTARGFFTGLQPDSQEYRERYIKAVDKFMQRSHTSTAPATPACNIQEAERYKNEGNEFFGSRRYAEAVDSYTKAITVSSSNPNGFMYFCNRGTAYFYLKDFESAVSDCKESIKLNPKHMKAYSRLVACYVKMNEENEAIKICESGLLIDSTNSDLRTTLDSLKSRQQPQAQNTPDLGSMGEMFRGLTNNPQMREAAEGFQNGQGNLGDFLNNPAIREIASNVMSNPQMMQNMMSAFGGLMGGQGGEEGQGGGLSGLLSSLGGMMGGQQQEEKEEEKEEEEEDKK